MNISGVSERDSRESDQTVSHPFDYTRRPPENDYYQGTGTIPVPVEHGESLGFSQIPQDLDVPGRGSMENDPAISNRFDSTHRPPDGNGLPIPTWIPSLPGFSSPPLAEPYLNRYVNNDKNRRLRRVGMVIGTKVESSPKKPKQKSNEVTLNVNVSNTGLIICTFILILILVLLIIYSILDDIPSNNGESNLTADM